MNLISSMRNASAALLMAAAALIASPASAQRGIDFDDPRTPPISTAGCRLGQSCTGYDLPFVENEFQEDFYGSSSSATNGNVQYFNNRQIFFYQEGVISFDSELPLGASVGGGLESLGTGNWFAPSFGTATDMLAYRDPVGQFRINWGPNQGVELVPGEGCDEFGFCVIDPIIQGPTFQISIRSYFFTDSQTPHIAFGYERGRFPQQYVSGYNYKPFIGGFTGPNPNDGQVDYFDLRYSGSRGAGGGGAVPEPGTWALLILGFGLAGAALRRRESRLTQA